MNLLVRRHIQGSSRKVCWYDGRHKPPLTPPMVGSHHFRRARTSTTSKHMVRVGMCVLSPTTSLNKFGTLSCSSLLSTTPRQDFFIAWHCCGPLDVGTHTRMGRPVHEWAAHTCMAVYTNGSTRTMQIVIYLEPAGP